MYSEAKKLHLIEKMLKVNSEAVLSEIESILKGELRRERAKAAKHKPSDYAGCISKEAARELLQHVEQSRNEWERDI